MFDVGFWEISVIGVVALIIVGPERLPGLARTAGLWIGKARRMISDVKRDIDRELKASEMGELKEGLDSAKKEVEKAANNIKQASGADEIGSTLKEAVDQGGSELDEIDQVAKQMEQEIGGSGKGSGSADGSESPAKPAADAEPAATSEQPADNAAEKTAAS